MTFAIFIGSLTRLFVDFYNFEQYLVSGIMHFVRGIEVAIVLGVSIIFLLVAVGITIRQVRMMPKSYKIETFDLDGQRAEVDGLRQEFSTHDVAESYARYYRKEYDRQYTFKVVGSMERTEYKI